ncbi:hypothetical protein A3842_14190 [Paenibacillus sp. P3E]|uniref:hypothetical protein n=1 Tax=Paenibacillus sp. P3E TaxID=1349435 RepID=UPI00093FF516|nr:hypothetical protein [Paenibacillus sp. P3E]OKP78535.1 hypothetical protein A3842_14190 [Paenibacillus sp. P3E]
MRTKWFKLGYGTLIVVFILLLMPKYSYNDPDTFWHIELGRYMIAHHTVLHHAIHTFYNDKLPYIPHEFGFQLLIAPLYQAFGWPGIYLLTAICLFWLIMGLLRLGKVSRKELGLPEEHPLLLPFVLLITSWIYYNYFKGRPQMISSGMIVWFFVYLREFQLKTSLKYATAMLLLSCAIANIHTGVWLVIAVFTGMAVLESLLEKKLNLRRAAVFILVWLSGLLNPAGAKSLLYIFTVTHNHFNMLINEWQPIQFNRIENLPILLLLLFFAVTLPFSLYKKPFRFFLMAGILYLGVTNFKQNLFMWLFIPYFAGVFFEVVPYFRSLSLRLGRGTLMFALTVGLSLNIVCIFTVPPAIDARAYPVKEMDYVLEHAAQGVRPRVLSSYGSSGYVMYRGGDVLCDGRQDPFITKASAGPMGWTAFERSMYGFSEYLPDIVKFDHPDFLIVKNNSSTRLYQDWVKTFGTPVFKGDYGSVFSL